MNYHKAIQKLYVFFYYKVYKQAGHRFQDTEANKALIDNFIKMLGNYYGIHSIGINWLIEYFCFTFAVREGQDTKRNISLNWLIGKKMFDRWLKRPDESSWQYQKFLTEYSINPDQIKNELYEEEMVEMKLDPMEEREKGRLIGDGQLYNCSLHTTMYNHRSVICLTCDNKILCKKMLREKFPRLYKSRGYK